MEFDSKFLEALQENNKLIRVQITVQLGLAGVGQREIREILGGSMTDINAIVKKLSKARIGKRSE